VFDQCQPGGVISPESCVYMDQWWSDEGLPDGQLHLPGGGGGGGASLSGNLPAPEIEDLVS
jgi:hypothetical protein